MRTTRSHYEILGLPRDATLTQIKRRYKQLVRKYHPDVAKDKATAHRLFLQIQEAYEVLSDSSRRRVYDATLTSQTTRTSSQVRGQAGPTDSISRYIKDAQFAFIQRRFNDAATYCKQALTIDGRNARVHAILGDVYRAQGKVNAATRAYSYAVQYNPADHESEKKLMNLIGKNVAQHQPRREESIPIPKRDIAVNTTWWAIAFFLLIMIGVYPGKPIPWLRVFIPQVSLWSWNLVGFIAGASVVVGIVLAVSGTVRHPDEELVFDSGSGWIAFPTGLILLFGSGVFFLGAAGFYFLVGLLQNNLSKSVMTTFACVICVVLLSALMYNPAATKQVLLFGGNVSFIPMLVGWYIGAMFRPLGD